MEQYEEIFGVSAPENIWGPKNYLFSTTSQLNGKLECGYLRRGIYRDNRQTALKTTKGPLQCPKIS